MITQTALITHIKSGYLWIKIQASYKGCDRCTAHQGCGLNVLSSMLPRRLFKIRAAQCDIAHILKPGDTVTVSITEQALLGSAMMVYLIPILGLLVGALLGSILGDVGSLLGTVFGFSIGYGFTRWCARMAYHHIHIRPKISV